MERRERERARVAELPERRSGLAADLSARVRERGCRRAHLVSETARHFRGELLVDGTENLLIADRRTPGCERGRDGIITTIAGGGSALPTDGLAATSVFLKGPDRHGARRGGNLLVCEAGGHRMWRLTPENPAGRRTADRDRR